MVKNPQANGILERVHQVLGQMLCTAELDMANSVTVGTLPKGYIRNVPLPRVLLCQSAQSRQVHMIPDYYDAPYVDPTYDTPLSLVESAAYVFSPTWHTIAINT